MKSLLLASLLSCSVLAAHAAAAPPPPPARAGAAAPVPAKTRALAAATIEPTVLAELLLDHAAGDLQLTRGARGWTVSGVRPGSAAATCGLASGDVVLDVGGAPVPDGAALRRAYHAFVEHGRTQVVVERAGRTVTLTLALGPTAPASPPRHDFRADVRVVDDHTYELSRARWEALLADPSSTAGQARLVPSIKSGKPNGFKLYAIRPGSLYDALGFENGDTLRRVNGLDLSTPEASQKAYESLRGADHFVVEVDRRGSARTHVYRLVP